LMKDAAQVRIYYYRISGGCTLYTDGLIDDDGRRLKTFMVISEEERVKSSQKWWNWGLIPDSKLVYSVTKYFFYNEFFDILALHDKRGNLLGYYCDIVTPLEKAGNEYFITDLVLDLWISPELTARELDWPEFEDYVARGMISPTLQENARNTIKRLIAEVKNGKFPCDYLDDANGGNPPATADNSLVQNMKRRLGWQNPLRLLYT